MDPLHGVRAFVRAGGDFNRVVSGRCLRSLLMVAASRGDAGVVNLLLQAGADVNMELQQVRRTTVQPARHTALNASSTSACARLLLLAGAAMTPEYDRFMRLNLRSKVSWARQQLHGAADGAAVRLGILQPAALAAAEQRVRAVDLSLPLQALQEAAVAAATNGSKDALLVRELCAWACALACWLASQQAANVAAERCFSDWSEPVQNELHAIRRRGVECSYEPEKTAVSALFAVSVANMFICKAAAADWEARAKAGAAALAAERGRAEETRCFLQALQKVADQAHAAQADEEENDDWE